LVLLSSWSSCLQLSISLSGQQNAIRELSEANALLGERLRRFEDQIHDPQSALRGYAGGVTRIPEETLTTTTVNLQRI